MALGKYSRVDGRKSSKYCSLFTISVIVAFCFVGVWMLTSSSVIPEISEVKSQESKSVLKEKTENEHTQFEDRTSDVLDELTNGDEKTVNLEEENNADIKKKQNKFQNEGDNAEQTQQQREMNLPNESSNGKIEYEEESNIEDGSDENEKTNFGNGGLNSESNTDGRLIQHKSDSGNGDNKLKVDDNKFDHEINEEKYEKDQDNTTKENIREKPVKGQFPQVAVISGDQTEILNETLSHNGAWSTQEVESKKEKESQISDPSLATARDQNAYDWKLCNVTTGPDYIPCLDNLKAIKKLISTKHYEHHERHCPDEASECLVTLPDGYKTPVTWPTSREKIWYYNVPHTKLAEFKGHQNWVKVTGEFATFPGGGTQFPYGALHYIDFIQESNPEIAWGKRSRVVLDVGCGVASFGGYLFDRDVLTMSLAPKDEHEAQVQFALERGIPAISAVMGTKRLPFPSSVFDVIHCARCRVPWHIEGGKLLLELNRVLRPGGYFVWSATPVYQNLTEDVEIWKAMSELTKSMCWELLVITKDKVNKVGVAIYRKPASNECYAKRSHNEPPLCEKSDDPNAAWNVPLRACMQNLRVDTSEHGAEWPDNWPLRLNKAPHWLNSSRIGVYGKSAIEDFDADNEHWKRVVSLSYLNGLGISWSSVRNVMDMRSVYGGFAAALKDLKVWVMNVVPIDSADTLPIIYDRGLFGIYHDWCESFSTYPRSYDLLHADHIFSIIKERCKLVGVIAEVDRILRPDGKLVVRDNMVTIDEVENIARSLHWEIRLTYSKDNEGLICIQKTIWRPTETEKIMYAY